MTTATDRPPLAELVELADLATQTETIIRRRDDLIRQAHHGGFSLRTIAAAARLSKDTVARIVRR